MPQWFALTNYCQCGGDGYFQSEGDASNESDYGFPFPQLSLYNNYLHIIGDCCNEELLFLLFSSTLS